MCNVAQILSRCDIALLQEVRDQKREAIPTLLAALNRYYTLSSYTQTNHVGVGESHTISCAIQTLLVSTEKTQTTSVVSINPK